MSINHKLKQNFKSICTYTKDGLLKARSNGIHKKIAIVLFYAACGIAVMLILIQLASYLFSVLYGFINQHFFGLAAVGGTISYFLHRKKERENLRKKQELEEIAAKDKIRSRFAESSYDKVRNFLYTVVLVEPNFEALTGLYRPINPMELGDGRTNTYIKNRIIFHQFRIPKTAMEDIDTTLVTSVMQSLLDKKIGTYGIPYMISPTHSAHNDILMVHSIKDLKTYVDLTTALTFNGEYAEQASYDKAISEALFRTDVDRTLEDSDYHE
ncbi:hypothetical protein AALB39_25730 [Lachnospiraceae bacterium 54-53]